MERKKDRVYPVKRVNRCNMGRSAPFVSANRGSVVKRYSIEKKSGIVTSGKRKCGNEASYFHNIS